MFKRLILTAICLLIFASLSFAQVEQGDSEVIFSGMYMSLVGIKDYSYSMGSLNLSYGKFVTDNLEIGIGPTLTFTRTKQTTYNWYGGEEDEDITQETHISGIVFFNINFSTSSKTVPYIAGQWYQSEFKIEKDEEFSDYSYANIGFGIRNFYNEYAALNTSINYGWSLAKDAEGGVLLITTGLSVIF